MMRMILVVALLAAACGKQTPPAAEPTGGAASGGETDGASEPTGEPRPDPEGTDPEGY